MSYYDIDDILTDAQKVPCVFELDIPGLGYLDNNASHTLKSGTRVEIPLWLAERLAVSVSSSNKSAVSLETPACVSPRVINALKADPKSVDLRALAQHFYGFGTRILELLGDVEMCDVLVESFRERAAEIQDHASNAGQGQRGGSVGNDGVEFLRGLDEVERGLFRASHDSSKAMRTWMGEAKK